MAPTTTQSSIFSGKVTKPREWVFEMENGLAGYRCSCCGEWRYKEYTRTCDCMTNEEKTMVYAGERQWKQILGTAYPAAELGRVIMNYEAKLEKLREELKTAQDRPNWAHIGL